MDTNSFFAVILIILIIVINSILQFNLGEVNVIEACRTNNAYVTKNVKMECKVEKN